MAVQSSGDAVTPKSTGNVEFDGKPVESTQTADNTSTGAVKYEAPGETIATHWGEDVTVVVPTPTEPFTMSVGWLSDAEAKVVEAPKKAAPKKAAAKATTKGKG